MASLISCLSSLVIPLLVTFLFYHVYNADKALIEKICQRSRDPAYCVSAFLSDPKSATADLDGLNIISNDLYLKAISDGGAEIGRYLLKFTDPGDLTPLKNCLTHMTDAYHLEERAGKAAGTKSYSEEHDAITSSNTKTDACRMEYQAAEKDIPFEDFIQKMEHLMDACLSILLELY